MRIFGRWLPLWSATLARRRIPGSREKRALHRCFPCSQKHPRASFRRFYRLSYQLLSQRPSLHYRIRTHSVIAIKSFNITSVTHSQEFAILIIIVMTVYWTVYATAEALADADVLDGIATVIGVVVLPISNALLDKVAKLLKEIQLHAILIL